MKNFFAGLGLLVVSVLLFINVNASTSAASFVSSGIGATTWPKICLVVLMLLSAALIFRTLIQEGGDIWKEIKSTAWLKSLCSSGSVRFVLAVIACFAYLQSLKYFGFFTATILFLIVMLFLLGYRSWKQLIPGPIILSVLVMLLFSKGIGVPLPAGRGIFAVISGFLS